MFLRPSLIALTTTLALAACSAPKTEEGTGSPAAAAPPAATAPASAAAPEGATGAATTASDTQMSGMTPEQHAAMDAANAAHGDTHANSGTGDMAGMDMSADKGAMASSMQAGWYTAGSFRACGSAKSMKVDKPADIDARIKAGGMSAGNPVYVKLEGMPMGDGYMLSKVVEVGSKTPVRDCPMTGTTTQVGG